MPKFNVTLEMQEVHTVTIEVEARDEEAAENKAIREAMRDYRGDEAIAWGTVREETEIFAEEVEEVEADDGKRRVSKKKAERTARKAKTQKVEGRVIAFPVPAKLLAQ